MTGTLVNTAAILAGSGIGLGVGRFLPARVKESVLTALGFGTIVLGVSEALRSANLMVPILAAAVGVVIGELLRLDVGLDRVADVARRKLGGAEGGRFNEAFVTSTLLFGVGPLALVGSTLEGMGDEAGTRMLLIKSLLDFFASIALAGSLGAGVTLSAAAILLYQGSLTAAGYLIGRGLPDALVTEVAATGGLLLLGMAALLLEVKKVRLANFLPALALAAPIAWLWQLLP